MNKYCNMKTLFNAFSVRQLRSWAAKRGRKHRSKSWECTTTFSR